MASTFGLMPTHMPFFFWDVHFSSDNSLHALPSLREVGMSGKNWVVKDLHLRTST